MSTSKSKISEKTVQQRLGATPSQNQFLLLYSILYEAEYRYSSVEYPDEASKEEAKQKMDAVKKQCHVDGLSSYMGYKSREQCIKDLKTSTRFDIDSNGYITIK